jgi:hypothetical protein
MKLCIRASRKRPLKCTIGLDSREIRPSVEFEPRSDCSLDFGMFPQLWMIGGLDEILDSDGIFSSDCTLDFGMHPWLGLHPQLRCNLLLSECGSGCSELICLRSTLRFVSTAMDDNFFFFFFLSFLQRRLGL